MTTVSVINPSAPAVVTRGAMPVERYIAGVLRRAHRTAEAFHGPDEARAILNVAQMFAEDLAKTTPEFDRVEFVATITGEGDA